MIYTLTLNPTVDYFVELESYPQTNEVNRVKRELYKAGGKGLNISKQLNLMGIDSTAITILAGMTGSYIEHEFSGLPHISLQAVAVEGNNRINVKAYFGNQSICINGKGPEADNKTVLDICNLLNAISTEDTVIISGSMMPGLTNHDLVTMCDVITKKNAVLIMDMENISLDLLKRCKPMLIKPNRYELEKIVEFNCDSVEKIMHAYKLIHKAGGDSMLVSLGADGALLLMEQSVLMLKQPDIVFENKVGAGDAMLASYIGKLSQGMSVEESLKWAGAAGNAVASTINDITGRDIQRFYEQMEIVKVR